MSSSSFPLPSAAFRHCPRCFLGSWPNVYRLAFPTTRAAFGRFGETTGRRRPE
jgi:hypothetical protein